MPMPSLTGRTAVLLQIKTHANSIQTLTRSEFDTGYSVLHSTAEGRQTTYRVERLSNGNERQTNTFPTGAVTTTNLSTNGSETITFADGSTSIPSKTPDPRFGMRSPLYKTTHENAFQPRIQIGKQTHRHPERSL